MPLLSDSATEQTLEEMIDTLGLACVLGALAEVCRAKADHVQTNWQDSHLAAMWGKCAGKLDTLSMATCVQATN